MQLREHIFFTFFDAATAARLCEATKIRRLSDGEILFRENDAADSMYLVLEGAVRLVKKDPGGADQTIAVVRENDFFGEFGVLDGGPRSAGAVAVGALVLAGFPRELILRTIGESGASASLGLTVQIINKIRLANERYVQDRLRHERAILLGEMVEEIVHDFRNPFLVLQTAIWQVGTLHDDDETKEMCNLAESQVRRMERMTEDLLEYARGAPQLRIAPLDVGGMLLRFEELNRTFLRTLQIELVVHPLYRRIEGDEEKLLRVLQNLAGNAADAFNRQPGRIEVRAEPDGDGVRIHVQDNGPGIPEAVRPNLFDLFVTHGKKMGVGLGMNIVKTVVEAHGGELTFDTATGAGTTFHIRLPARPPAKT